MQTAGAYCRTSIKKSYLPATRRGRVVARRSFIFCGGGWLGGNREVRSCGRQHALVEQRGKQADVMRAGAHDVAAHVHGAER